VKKNSTIKTIVLEDSLNEIEVMVSQLRNAGVALRSFSVDSEEEFSETLNSQNLDMVLCNYQSDDPSIIQVMAVIKQTGKDIPVIVIDERYNQDSAYSSMSYGVRDYVCKKELTHLALVIQREASDLDIRRKYRLQEKTIRETEKHCQALLESSRDAIAYVHEGMHIYTNPVYLEMFGFTGRDEVDGIPIMDMVAPEDHATFKEFLKKYSNAEREMQSLEVRGLKPDGKKFNAIMEFSPATIDTEPCTQIIIRAKSRDKELEKKLQHLTNQDILTGLYNRQYFLEELSHVVSDAIAGGPGRALLFIEPDNFKELKESAGIAGTDLILGDLGNIIKNHTNEDSVSARFGDNTFTMVLDSDEAKHVYAAAEKLKEEIENYIADVSGRSITLTVSIGINIIGETATSAQEIISNADLACEMMHKDGGNKIHTHNPIADLQASKDRDQYWNHVVRDALKNDKFKLAYQPIASLTGDESERYEVLLRMDDEEGKELLPGKFIPVAEQSNLITKIDRWVINHAIEVLTDRRNAGYDTLFFVKISARTLTDEDILPWIGALLKKAMLPGNALVFELSEPDAVTHLKFAKVFSQGLQQLHVGFSLEDFGNGMNSFQLLKHLHVDYLKIDGSIMHNLASDKESQAMVKSIVEMASTLGKPVIAEFVEDANSLSILWQSGIQFIQGHFLQKPTSTMTFDFSCEDDSEEISIY